MHCPLDPAVVIAQVGVDSWVARHSTTFHSPGHKALELSPTHQGSPRITLTGVLPAFGDPSTDHARCYDSRVGSMACLLRHDVDIHTLQSSGVPGNGTGYGSPARHSAGSPWAGTGAGHRDGLHCSSQPHLFLQLQQHEVIIVGLGLILGMWHLAGHTHHLLSRFPPSYVVLAQGYMKNRAGTMSSSDDPLI